MPAKKDPLEFGLRPRLFTGAPDGEHSIGGESVFLFGRPPRPLVVLWQVRKKQITGQGERQSYYSVDDE